MLFENEERTYLLKLNKLKLSWHRLFLFGSEYAGGYIIDL